MKHFVIFIFAAISLACGSSAAPIQQNANARASDAPSAAPRSVTDHASENEKPSTNTASGEKKKWTQSGEPIETKEFDSAIAVAEKKLGGKPADVTAKKTLATAYFKRAFALTEARQYASALGDYRRAMKYDPSNPEAKSWIDKIILIYSGMNKDYPKEGEEPPALPFTKGN